MVYCSRVSYWIVVHIDHKIEPKPFCHTCNRSLSVRHVLIECSLYARERIGLFIAASRRELFTNATSDIILQFMHRIRLYDQV